MNTDPTTSDLRRYTLPGGWEVLVGRSDSANDTLSLKLARPDDYWFHVRGMPGSHVILRCPPKVGPKVGPTAGPKAPPRAGSEAGQKAGPSREPDRPTLKAAGALAAYFSKARGAGVVAVSCTRARFVTKPRGAERGTVQIRREIVLKVRPGLGEAVAAGLLSED